MAKSNDPNVIQVGLSADVEGFVKEIKKELASVKGLGLSDAIKDEIKSIEGMLDGLAKSFSDGMDMKLDTKTFAAFEVKVSKDMQAIDERVTSLEDSMQALVTTMDTADSGKLSSALQDIGSKMQLLNGFTDETVKTMRELIDIASKSNGLVQFADNSTLGNLKKESELLERIKKISNDLANTEDYDRGVEWGKNKKLATALAELSDAYKKVLDAKGQYDKAIKENADNFTLAQVKKEYAETFAYLNSLRDEADNVFGQDIANTQIPNEIHKILQDSREEIESFYEWSVNRLSSVEEARNRINKKAAITVDKSENGKASIKVPMQVSTTGRGLAEQARRILNSAQDQLTEPLKVEFAFQSHYSSRKTNNLLKEWQQQIANIDNPELREKFEGLYETIAKDFQKEIKIHVTSDINKEEIKVKKTIEQIQKLVGKKIHIFPEFDIKQVDVEKLQKKVDRIARQLKLNVQLFPKGATDQSNAQLEALKALSDMLKNKLENLNKNYLANIKKSLADILALAQTLKNSAVQTDAPIEELVSSVKDLTVAFQQAFGVFSKEDIDGIFERMQNSVKGIRGSLEGTKEDNPLVAQLHEILDLYKEYQRLGGTKTLSDIGGTKKVQKWLADNYAIDESFVSQFKTEGKNASAGYAEGMREGIPDVQAAAKEMAEAALEAVRAAQDSNSPSKRFKKLGKDGAAGYAEGFKEETKELQNAVRQYVESGIKQAEEPLKYSERPEFKEISDIFAQLYTAKKLLKQSDAAAIANNVDESIELASLSFERLNAVAQKYQFSVSRLYDSVKLSDEELLEIAEKIQNGTFIPNSKDVVEFNSSVDDAVATLENLYGKGKDYKEIYKTTFDAMREGSMEYGDALSTIISEEEHLLELERIKSNYTLIPFDNRNYIDVPLGPKDGGIEYYTIIRKTNDELKEFAEKRNAIIKDMIDGNEVGLASKMKESKLPQTLQKAKEETKETVEETGKLVNLMDKVTDSSKETKETIGELNTPIEKINESGTNAFKDIQEGSEKASESVEQLKQQFQEVLDTARDTKKTVLNRLESRFFKNFAFDDDITQQFDELLKEYYRLATRSAKGEVDFPVHTIREKLKTKASDLGIEYNPNTERWEKAIINSANESKESVDKLKSAVDEVEKTPEAIKDNIVDFSSKSKKALDSTKDDIEDVGQGTVRILNEIGIAYDALIDKINAESKKGQFQERIAFIKDGKVIESLKGQYGSVVLPEVSKLPKSDKVVHTHPYPNSLGGAYSPDDYLEWYKMMAEGISTQFELYWRKKNVKIDFSGMKEELVGYVITALMNIVHVAGAQFEDAGKSIPLQVSEAYNLLSNQLLQKLMEDYGGIFSSNYNFSSRETKRYDLQNLYNALETITTEQRNKNMHEGDWSWDRYLAQQTANIKSGQQYDAVPKQLSKAEEALVKAKYAAEEYDIVFRQLQEALRIPGTDIEELINTLKRLNKEAKSAIGLGEYLKRADYLESKLSTGQTEVSQNLKETKEETKETVKETGKLVNFMDKAADSSKDVANTEKTIGKAVDSVQESVETLGKTDGAETLAKSMGDTIDKANELASIIGKSGLTTKDFFQGLVDGSIELTENLKKLLEYFGLLSKGKINTSKLISEGTQNLGGFVSSKVTMIHRDLAEDFSGGNAELIDLLDGAYEKGVPVARILKIISDNEKEIFEIQETAPGKSLVSGKGILNPDALKLSNDQLLQLLMNLQKLHDSGLILDENLSNIIIDKNKGATFIDNQSIYDFNPEDEKADYTLDNFISDFLFNITEGIKKKSEKEREKTIEFVKRIQDVLTQNGLYDLSKLDEYDAGILFNFDKFYKKVSAKVSKASSDVSSKTEKQAIENTELVESQQKVAQSTEEVVASKKKEEKAIEDVAAAEEKLASTKKGKGAQATSQNTEALTATIAEILNNTQKTSEAMKEVADNEDKATESAKILNDMYDNLGKIVLQIDKDANEAATAIALIVASAEKLEKVDSPFAGTKVWSRLNRRRKSETAEDSIAAKNIQTFSSVYQQTGQKAILDIIKDYASKSNLNDDLKKRVQEVLSSAIKTVEKTIETTLKEGPQTKTVTMTNKQLKEYLKKYAIWGQNEEFFNYNFKVEKETMQKDGRAYRIKRKDGKLGGWRYNVEVPVNQLSKLDQVETKVDDTTAALKQNQQQAEKTGEALGQVGTTGRHKLDKVIGEYRALYQEQQSLYKQMSPTASENGGIAIASNYAELSTRLEEVTNKMQALSERGFNNFKVNLRDIALGHREATNAAVEQAKAEKQVQDVGVSATKNLKKELTKIVSNEAGFNTADVAKLLGINEDTVNERVIKTVTGGGKTKQIVDDLMVLYETLHKDEEQAKETNEALANVGTKITPSLQKHIDKYQELYKAQQDILSSMGSMATSGGKIQDVQKYKELKSAYDSKTRQMQKEMERGYKNFHVNLRELALGHTQVAEAAQAEAKAETQVQKTEASIKKTNITPTLQKKIDEYRELQAQLDELYSKMSPTAGQTSVDTEAYKKMKAEAASIEGRMQKLSERTYKNHGGQNLRDLALGYTKVADAAQLDAKAETQVQKTEESIVKTNISKTLQKKIDEYKQLQARLNELYSMMSPKAGQTKVDTESYKKMKAEAASIEGRMRKLSERTYKNHSGLNLKALAEGEVDVASSSTQAENALKGATSEINKEGDAAQKGTKKKERLAKAELKLAKASKKAADGTDEASKAIEREYKHAEKMRDKVIQEEIDIRSGKVLRTELSGMLSNMEAPKFNKNFTSAFSARLEELRNKIKNLLSKDEIDMSALEAIRSEFADLDGIVSNTKEATKYTLAEETSITGMQAKIASFMDQNTAMSRQFKNELDGLYKTLENGGDITLDQLKAIGAEFNRISARVKALHQTGQSLGSSFLKQLKGANAQLIATYFSFQDFIRYAREGFNTVVEVDTALTELRKVSNASDDRLAQSFAQSTITAKELGSTISDVIGVTADWARLGYSVDDAEKLARVTTLFKTVGDNMTAEETSSYMVSTLQGFQMATEQAEEIADKFNEVANNFAIDTKGIGEALQRSSASFNAANTSLSESIALVTATNTVVQNPEAVGTLWKTLSARIRGAKTELQELDEEEDEFTETTSKLQGLVKGLTGFDILEKDGKTFKSIYDIILGIGKEWKNLSDIEQASLGEALAGKRNANALYAVLNNIETLEKAYQTAEDAQGSAQREQENYAKSIQYSIDVLKASAQEFWTTLIESGMAKKVIDFLTQVLNVLTKITEATNGMPVLAGAGLLAAFGRDPQKFVNGLSSGVQKFFDFFREGTIVVNETTAALEGGAEALEFVAVEVDDVAEGMATLGTKTIATKSAFATLMANPITPWVIGIGVALGVAAVAWDHFTTTVAEAQKDLDETTVKIESLQTEIEELENLDYRNDEQEERLRNLEKELEFQEKIYDIERKRVLQEKIGNKFSDWFDKDNYGRQDLVEKNTRLIGGIIASLGYPVGLGSASSLLGQAYTWSNDDSYSELMRSFKKNQKDISDLEATKKRRGSWLNVEQSYMSTDVIDYYTKELGDLSDRITKFKEDNIIVADDLNAKALEYIDTINYLQEAIDDGILVGSDKKLAEDRIDEFTKDYQAIYQEIGKTLREQGLFDYSAVISSTLNKTDFKGYEAELIKLAKDGSLSGAVLEESFSGLVSELALASVKTEELYDYILELADIPNVRKMSESIASGLQQTYFDERTGVALNQARIVEEKLQELFTEEELRLIPKLDIDYSGMSVEGAIAKIQEAINQSSETPVEVEATIIDSVEGVNKRLKTQFDELGNLYQNIFHNEKGFTLSEIDNDQLESLRKAFIDLEDENGNKVGASFEGGEEAINKFIDTLTSAETKSLDVAKQQEVVQDAFNELATAYFYAADGLDELNDETKDALAQQFKMLGITNADEVIEAGLAVRKELNQIQEDINKLDFSKLADGASEALEDEREKLASGEFNLPKEIQEKVLSGKLQSKFGNVDMDNRSVIRYNQEVLDSFEEALKSWKYYDDKTGEVIGSYYDEIAQEIANGGDMIDTVWGTKDKFQLGNQKVEIAFTPIMVDENGQNPQFLSEGTVTNYIDKVLAQADKDVKASGEKWSKEAVIKRAFEIDLEGMNTEEIDSQGRVVGEKFVHGMIAQIGDSDGLTAGVVSKLLHFAGEEGAYQLAGDALKVYTELKEKAAEGTLDLADMTAKEISVLENEGIITSSAAQSIAQYALQKQLANGVELTTSQSVQALADLATQAGIDIVELKVLQQIMQMMAQKDAAAAHGASTDAAAIQANVDALIDDAMAELREKMVGIQVGLDFTKAKTDAGKGGSDSADAYVEAYEKEKKELENQRDLGLISEKEYLDKLKALIDRFFKDRAEYAEKYMEEMKGYMDGLLSYYNSVISGVTTLLDHRINKIQKNKDETIDALNEEKEAAEERYQAEIDAIQEAIDAKQAEIDKLNEQIEAIDKANEARDRAINLQEKEYNLQRMMNQRTKLVCIYARGYSNIA